MSRSHEDGTLAQAYSKRSSGEDAQAKAWTRIQIQPARKRARTKTQGAVIPSKARTTDPKKKRGGSKATP